MMQHNEHWGSEQNVVQPLSPRVHFLRVPCHRRFSLPGGRFTPVKWPRASTESLEFGIVSGDTLCQEKGEDDIPVCVVLVHVLLRCHDLVDGSNFRARGGVSP